MEIFVTSSGSEVHYDENFATFDECRMEKSLVPQQQYSPHVLYVPMV